MNDQETTDADYPRFPAGAAPDASVRTQAGPTPSKAMATWSLVLAAIPAPILWAVSIGLGIAVLRRSRDGRNHGKGLVIAAFVVVAVWIVILVTVVAVNVAGTAERDATGSVTTRGDIPVSEIRTGDCMENDIAEEVEMMTMELIPCEEPHYFEAYATFVLPEGDFPGQKEVDRLSEGGCIKRFDDFVGVGYGESNLELLFMRPYEDGWAYDRGVACLITTETQVAGTLKDAKH